MLTRRVAISCRMSMTSRAALRFTSCDGGWGADIVVLLLVEGLDVCTKLTSRFGDLPLTALACAFPAIDASER